MLLVGGGVGLAPLRALIYALENNVEKFTRISIKYGARSPDEAWAAWGAQRRPGSAFSLPAMPPCDAPTKREMAEVTVMAVCRELQNSQKTRPSNKHA